VEFIQPGKAGRLRLICDRLGQLYFRLVPMDTALQASVQGLDRPRQTLVKFEHGHKTMILKWFNGREAAEIGAALADQFALQTASESATRDKIAIQNGPSVALRAILQRADREVRTLRLNFYKKARFANSFKWRLTEKGVDREVADEMTQLLVLHLSQNQAGPSQGQNSVAAPADRSSSAKVKYLLTEGNRCFARGAYAEAAAIYQRLVELDSRNADALNNLGSAFSKQGLLTDAERCLRQAVGIKPDYPEAHCNLGIVLRARGETAESEIWLRRALKLRPNYVDARINLGVTLLALGRLREARARFEKVLKVAPRHADALYLMGHVAKLDGRFEEAEARFKRALDIDPKMPNAWAALAGTRKMTSSDAAWLERAEEIAASGIMPFEEAELRFAIGKYCDDVNDFEQAFENYKRANQLLKTVADTYERDARTCFVDDMIRVYTPEAISTVKGGTSASMKPVFVVGMPRSGTSLVEQIIASHPAAKGAGELGFCGDAVLANDSDLRQGILSELTRKKLAETYLPALAARSGDALRIVDKAPVNSDYLGVIYSVFPNARIIYMRRDPIDTCLSCYFQHFSVALNFTMDLSDLAHYYREHQRLMAHWRAVLPPGSILDVPYADLVADQEAWTRKILDFLGLEWDERCLDFHKTERQVVTASTWQVRQKIYRNSVARWRNYEKFISPLLRLRD
jgi:tetratricopeptide (TPR) repeat protein